MPDAAALPAVMTAWAFAFALVLCRCSAAVMLLPGFGETEVPAVIRAGLAVALVALVLPSVGVVAAPDGLQSVCMIGAELLVGGVLGWLARCVAMALAMSGQFVSLSTGLSNVIVADPALGQSSSLMRLFSLLAPVLMLKTGLWMLPVAALAGSYDLVPVGHLLSVGDGAQAVVDAVADAFALALRLAAPFVLANVVWQVALGLLSRLIPQLQVYFAAMPGQILGGLALLGLLCGTMIAAWLDAAQSALGHLPGLP